MTLVSGNIRYTRILFTGVSRDGGVTASNDGVVIDDNIPQFRRLLLWKF